MTDPYVDPKTGVFRNKLGLTNAVELQAAETRFAIARDIQLAAMTVPGAYDLAHLCRFHRKLFGDVYPWAGKIRTVNIEKSMKFCAAAHIDEYAATAVFPQIVKVDFLRGLDRDALIRAAARILGDINALHPFREGNGRTQRAFMRQLVAAAGWSVQWHGMDPDNNVTASERAMLADYGPMEDLLDRLVTAIP